MMIFLFRNLIIQFSHDFKIIYENGTLRRKCSFDDEQRACKFLTLVALFSNSSWTPWGHAQTCTCTKKDRAR